MTETVINDERMSLGTSTEMTRDPARSFDQTVAPVEEYSPPPTGNSTLEAFKAVDMPREVIQGAMTWIERGPAQSQAELDVIDTADHTAGASELRNLWQGKYAANLKAIDKYLDQLPQGVGDVIRNARGPDGHAYANDPAILARLASPALKPRPELGSGSVDAQIKEIESFMKTNRTAYTRDEPLQARYRELLTLKVR